MWCRAGSVFAHLRPDAFARIEFGRTRWKLIDMQTWMAGQEIFHLAAAMDGMPVPQQHDGPCDMVQQVLQKGDHFVPSQRVPIGINVQLDLALA